MSASYHAKKSMQPVPRPGSQPSKAARAPCKVSDCDRTGPRPPFLLPSSASGISRLRKLAYRVGCSSADQLVSGPIAGTLGEMTKPRHVGPWRPAIRHLRAMSMRLLVCLVLPLAIAFQATPATADMNEPLETRLVPEVVESLFPNADGLGKVAGDPPVATVLKDGEIVGYLFSTHETLRPAGYSGNSFDIVVALSKDGVILGQRVLEQHEPLLVSGGAIPPEHFRRFLSRLRGTDIKMTRRYLPDDIDAVSGATVSAMIMSRAIVDSAILVGYLKEIIDDGSNSLSLDVYNSEDRSWSEMMADGSVRSLTVTNWEVREAFLAQLGESAVPEAGLGANDGNFITLYVALATPPAIGRNLFGARAFRAATQSSKAGEQQLLVASSGPYKWIPRNPWLVPIFDRVRVVQNGRELPLLPENFYWATRLAVNDHPRFTNAARFRVPSSMDFEPLEPWTLELRVFEEVPEGVEPRSVDFALPYRIPAQYVLGDDLALEEAGFKEPHYVGFGQWRESTLTDWQRSWVEKQWLILGLVALLIAVTSVMLFQHRLSQSRRLHAVVRTGILAITVVWVGWVAGAQLTILMVINYLHAAFTDVGWQSILFNPLLVILSIYVAISLLLWGRGVFCGWLCPFGALQEILNKIATAVRAPQFTVPQTVQQRLWALKYVLAAGILGLAAYSLSMASIAAEIEPFKTAISLKFQRNWPYVVYAGLLLFAGLFIERFFCRYLCPLGAVLALAGRLHVLNWLKRRPECGNPCKICESSCPVGAVEESGAINMNECFQYLDCQVDYFDDQRCPPLVASRKRLENMRQPSAAGLATAGE